MTKMRQQFVQQNMLPKMLYLSGFTCVYLYLYLLLKQ
jgi:hypothetical protein